MATHFTRRTVMEQIEEMNRLVDKVCHKCGRGFQVAAYFAPMPAFSSCKQEDCKDYVWDGRQYVRKEKPECSTSA